jgi:hypothetical protein
MPINFEATFTQPLLAEIDAGRIRSASDWARLVTKYYVATIKTGLPNGIPPTLPSPAQLGAPYAMGNTFYNTIDSRSRLMENIIKAYFLTEEIAIQKGGIKGLAQTIKQYVAKAKIIKATIKTTINQLEAITKEISDLPKTITELYNILQEQVQQELDEIASLVTSIDDFKLQANNPNFDIIFAQELDLVNSIRNFEFKLNLETLQQLNTLLSGLDSRLKALSSNVDSNAAFKRYIIQKITTTTTNILQLVNTVISPTEYINFYNSLAQTNQRAKIIVEKLKKIEFVKQKLEPKQRKLEAKIKAKRKELVDKVESKIDQLKADLKIRAEELAKKKSEGKDAQYKKAAKTLKEYRSKYEAKVKEKQATIKKYRSIIKQLNLVFVKGTTIVLGVVDEIKTTVASIEQDIASTTYRLEDEIQTLQEFLNNNNLQSIANQLTLILTNAKISAQQFIVLLKQKNAVVKSYLNQIYTLFDKDIPVLLNLINNTQNQTTVRDTDDDPSFLTFLNFYEKKVQPLINKIKKYIEKQTAKIKKSIDEVIDKGKQDLTEYAINLLPVKSDVEDIKAKKLAIEEKKRLIADKRAKLKKIRSYVVQVRQIVRGSTALVNNLSQGIILYSRNQQAITDISNGYFGYKSIDQPPSRIRAIEKQKRQFTNRLQDLQIVEGLVMGINLLIEDIKSNPSFLQDWKTQVVDNIKDQTQLQIFEKLGTIFTTPINNPIELIDIVDQLTYAIAQDRTIVQNIKQLEKRYIRKAARAFGTLGASKTKAGEYFKGLADKLNGDISLIALLLKELGFKYSSVSAYIDKFTADIKKEVNDAINTKLAKIEEDNKKSLDTLKEKKVNIKAQIMSITFGLATRALWSGATWFGPTATQFTVISIGPFKPIKGKVEGGASAMIREMATGFENQIKILTGVYANAPAGIAPIPFVGYL